MTTATEGTNLAAAADAESATGTGKSGPTPAAVPDKRRALGRGLEALLPGPRVVASGIPAAVPAAIGGQPGLVGALQAQAASGSDAVLQVPVELIERNPYQTRILESEEPTNEAGSTLQELAASIEVNGVIQPITVRPGKDGRYVLITGERRWKAAKLAGKLKIPAIVKQVSDQQAAEITIIENLQREDLNCWEQAKAFARLSQDFGLTQEQIGQRVGVSRETVSNYMRLLKLPEPVQWHLARKHLGFSEARVLLTLADPGMMTKVAEEAIQKHLSVVQLEDMVMKVNLPAREQQEKAGGARWVDPNVRAAQQELERVLGVRVRIRDRKGKGKIVIEYSSLEDFDRVIEMLEGKQK